MTEIDLDRHSFDMVEFNTGEFFKGEGNPNRDRLVNQSGSISVRCPFCAALTAGN